MERENIFPVSFSAKDHCISPIIAHGEFHGKKAVYEGGNIISINCVSGYHFENPSGVSTCWTGMWNPLPICKGKSRINRNHHIVIE